MTQTRILKRGDMQNTIVYLIIGLVALIILAGAIVSVHNAVVSTREDSINCAADVRATQTMASLSKGDVSPKIICPTKNMPVPAGTKEEIFIRLAQDIKECKDTWEHGEEPLFDEDGVYCHLCSFITFEQNRGVLQGWTEFMQTYEVEPETTLFEYIVPEFHGTRYQDQQGNMIEFQMRPFPIDTTQNYAVLFHYVRGEEQIERFFIEYNKEMESKAKAGAIGFGIGAGVIVGTGVFVCGLATGSLCWWIAGGTAVAAGTTTGWFSMEFFGNQKPHDIEAVWLRPLTIEEVEQEGCQYSFAHRK